MRLDRDRAQADQVRAAVGLGVDLVAQRAELRPQQQAAELALPGRRGGLADLVEQPGAGALEQLEHDVAGEAVGDDDVDRAERDVAALDVAGEAQARVVGQQPVGVDHEAVALALLVAVREQADARLVDAEDAGREGGAHVRELVQLIGPRIRASRRCRARRSGPSRTAAAARSRGAGRPGGGAARAGRRPARRRLRRPRRRHPHVPRARGACSVTTEASSRSRAARAGSSSCGDHVRGVHDLDLRVVAHERLELRRRTAQQHAQRRRARPRRALPRRSTSAPWSLPIASSATVTAVLTPRAARSRAPCTSCTWGTCDAREWASRIAGRRPRRSPEGTP